MVNRVALRDFPSTVHTNFYGVIYTAISHVYYLRALFVLWRCEYITYPVFKLEKETKGVSTEFYSESTGVYGFSFHRAHKSVLPIECFHSVPRD